MKESILWLRPLKLNFICIWFSIVGSEVANAGRSGVLWAWLLLCVGLTQWLHGAHIPNIKPHRLRLLFFILFMSCTISS